MDIAELILVLRRRFVLVVMLTLLGLGAGAGATVIATPEYSSTARLFVSTAQSNTAEAVQGGQFSVSRVKSYAELARSREVAERVVDDLQLDLSPEEVRAKVSAEVTVETVILGVTVQDQDPQRSQAIAQAYAETLEELVRELETPTGETVPLVRASIVDSASLPTSPSSPDPVRNILVGLLLGMVAGISVAIMRDRLDKSVKSDEDVVDAASAPILGHMPYDSDSKSMPLTSDLPAYAPRVEAFRVLRTNLQFADVDKGLRVLVITSPLPHEGKTTTAVNLAISIAQGGSRVLLVEADLRRPNALNMFGRDRGIGVTSVLVGQVGLSDAVQSSGVEGLSLLGSGPIPPNPTELVQSQAMNALLETARDRYDYVLVDAPPLLPVADAAVLSAHADGTLVIVRYGKTTRAQLAGAVARLSATESRVVGAVINMVPQRGGGYGYGYGYGYGPEVTSRVKSRAERRAERVSRGGGDD